MSLWIKKIKSKKWVFRGKSIKILTVQYDLKRPLVVFLKVLWAIYVFLKYGQSLKQCTCEENGIKINSEISDRLPVVNWLFILSSEGGAAGMTSGGIVSITPNANSRELTFFLVRGVQRKPYIPANSEGVSFRNGKFNKMIFFPKKLTKAAKVIY